MRTGRRRNKHALRDANGKSRGESPEMIRAVALSYRARDVGWAAAGDPLAGYTLGRLFLRYQRSGFQDPGAIDERQFNAGQRYANLIRRHAGLMGLSLGNPKSQGFELVASGLSCAQEADDETVLKVRRQWNDCYRALMEAGRQFELGPEGIKSRTRQRVATLTYDVCLDRVSAETLTRSDIGLLRIGLNTLAKVLT
jgi:hypothetical protein